MRFEFATAQRIIFGNGVLKEAGGIAKELGTRAIVVTGLNPERSQPLLELLDAQGMPALLVPVLREPSVATVQAGVASAQEFGADLVIAMGGGSAIDTGKAIASLLANPGDIYNYLEVVGKGQPLKNASLPLIAIPTTAGTGSEVTRNAVIYVPEHKVKVSIRSATMLPRAALVDPELTYGMPPAITASTGLDALTQVIEPYVSSRANPMTDALCREGIMRAVRSLRCAYENGSDAAARYDMAFASLCGGLALANAGLGAVHGFAGPFGGMYDAPHGATCAALLPYAFAVNAAALAQRAPGSPALARFQEVAVMLTGNRDATPEDGARWLRDLSTALDVAPLSEYGFTVQAIPELVAKGKVASSMKANPIVLTDEELTTILTQAL